MLLNTYRRLSTLLVNPIRSTLVLVLASSVAAVSEGAAILVVVRVAVDLAADTVESDFIPFFSSPDSAMGALAIAGGLALTTLATHFVIARESAAIAADVLLNARKRALRAFAAAEYPVQAAQRLGSLQETVSSLSLTTSTVGQVLATGLANGVMLVVFICLALVVNPLGTVVVTTAGAGIFLIIRPLTVRNRASSRSFASADARFSEETTNFVAGSLELRSFGVASAAAHRLESELGHVVEGQRLVRFRTAFATTLYRDIAILLLVASVAALSLLDSTAVGSSSAVVVLVIRALASAQAVNSMLQLAGERGPTLELLLERIDELERARDRSGSATIATVETIQFRDVHFQYPAGPRALKGVNLSLVRGQVVGITGASGAGKSTLLQILLRLHRPSSGMVLVNGVDAQLTSFDDWTRLVAYVPQEPTLFEGTIRDNVSFFRDVDESLVTAAIDRAHVRGEIEALPKGVDSALGRLGAGLSGGQKQRIAIARALVGRPDVLVMDEPSSALDSTSDAMLKSVYSELAAAGTMVIIVSHRTGTLDACDRLFELVDGRITEVDERSPDRH